MTKQFYIWALVIIVVVVGGLVVLKSAVGPSSVSSTLTLSEPVSASDWAEGSSTAPVTLVEYGDFQCPACGQYYPTVKQLKTTYGDKLRLVYRYFPLTIHPNALPAAKAAEAAGKQGKFWEMYDQLYTHQTDWSDLPNPTATFTAYAKSLGLDTTKFTTDMTSPEVAARIKHDLDSGDASTVLGTPTFFLNGQQLTDLKSTTALEQAVAAALK